MSSQNPRLLGNSSDGDSGSSSGQGPDLNTKVPPISGQKPQSCSDGHNHLMTSEWLVFRQHEGSHRSCQARPYAAYPG